MELRNAQKRLSHLQRMTCLGITGGMRSTPMSALEVMLGNECSYVLNLIKITDEMPLLLAPRDKFVTLNIFGWKFSVDFPTREDWSTECAGSVAPNGLKFFTDGSLCAGRAGAGVFSYILNVS
jgi:hypothetical protein